MILMLLSVKHMMPLKIFLKKLNEISYHNAFARVKHLMKRKKLIYIDYMKNISLTKPGLELLEKLKICEMIVNPESYIQLNEQEEKCKSVL